MDHRDLNAYHDDPEVAGSWGFGELEDMQWFARFPSAQTTAENLARWLYGVADSIYSPNNIVVAYVEVRENPDTSARFEMVWP
jgi:hypothetical protein